nr:ATP-binding protein [Mucilaginibacter sp. L294]
MNRTTCQQSKDLSLFLRYFWVFCVLIYSVSCNKVSNRYPEERQQQVAAIFSSADKLPATQRPAFIYQSFRNHQWEPGDQWKKYNYLRGFYYTTAKDYYRASQYADTMIAVLKNIDPLPIRENGKMVRAYFFNGDAEMAIGNYGAAFKNYDNADRQLKKGPVDSQSYFNYDFRLAEGFYRQGNYQRAGRFYKHFLNRRTYEKDPFVRFCTRQMIIDDIGLCFANNHQPDSAIFYYNQALAYITQQENKFNDHTSFIQMAKGVIYANKAAALLDMGRSAEAEPLLNASIFLNSPTDRDPEYAEFSRERLADLYLKRHQTKQAVMLLDTIKGWTAGRNIQHAQNYFRLFSRAKAQTGDFKMANSANERYIAITDSVTALKKNGVEENLEKLIAFNEKLREIDRLEEDSNRSQQFLWLTTLSLLLAICTAGLIFRNYYRSKQMVKHLNVINNEIQHKHDDLEMALVALELSNKKNSRMTQLIAHDLRNPISAVHNFVDLVDLSITDPVELKEITDLLKSSCKDALSLIDDMLDNDALMGEFTHETLQLNELLSFCVKQIKLKAAEKSQEVVLDLLSVNINADAEKLKRVFGNLLTNAIKFSYPGATIYVSMRTLGDEIQVLVKDGGVGIPADMQPKLFDLRSDIKRKGTALEPSFGLGLFICKQIIDAHGGRIWLESDGQTGTTFYVSLKVTPVVV